MVRPEVARKRAADWYKNNTERAKATRRAGHKRRKQEAREAGTSWYQLHKDKFKAEYTKKYASLTGRAAFIWRAAKSRSKKLGVPFSLSKEKVVALLETGKCALSGIPFDYSKTDTLRNPFSPSIDRIKPKLGYTDDNVRAICTLGNFARSNWGDDALLKFCKGVAKKRREAKE